MGFEALAKWAAVRNWSFFFFSGKRGEGDGPFKSRKGFGFHVRQARARPSNTSVRDLMSDDRYTSAVLDFLEKTRVGEVREGVICR